MNVDEMKYTGIIMSGDHSKKCQDGTKTNTRRTYGLEKINENPDNWEFVYKELDTFYFEPKDKHCIAQMVKCPYGQVGDRLWVRETWRIKEHNVMKLDDTETVVYEADGVEIPRRHGDINYNEYGVWLPSVARAGLENTWRPARYMPHIISRITLEITELRAEGLRKVTLVDAIAEGFRTIAEFIKAFIRLNGLPEDADPWVWIIGFKVVNE